MKEHTELTKQGCKTTPQPVNQELTENIFTKNHNNRWPKIQNSESHLQRTQKNYKKNNK